MAPPAQSPLLAVPAAPSTTTGYVKHRASGHTKIVSSFEHSSRAQREQLERLAALTGRSKGALIREALDDLLARHAEDLGVNAAA